MGTGSATLQESGWIAFLVCVFPKLGFLLLCCSFRFDSRGLEQLDGAGLPEHALHHAANSGTAAPLDPDPADP
jgi:hypothetical protein